MGVVPVGRDEVELEKRGVAVADVEIRECAEIYGGPGTGSVGRPCENSRNASLARTSQVVEI
jgi:hypothetical protein